MTSKTEMRALQTIVRISAQQAVENRFKKLIGDDGIIVIDKGTAYTLGVSESTISRAMKYLETEGYRRFYIPIKQEGTNKTLNLRVLTRSSMTFREVMKRRAEFIIVTKDSTPIQPNISKKQAEANKRRKHADNVRSMRMMKRNGFSNVDIGHRLGVSESTIRRWLKEPLTAEDKLIERMEKVTEEAKQAIMDIITSSPEFETVFGKGLGPEFYLNVHTKGQSVGVYPIAGKHRMDFFLNFSATKVVDNR